MPQNENVNFKIDHFDNLGRPFRSGNNEYSIFESIENRYGVYIFQDNNSNSVLYVGEAREQDLKERITQNYTQRDSGGNFRKNWCEMENRDFDAFKTALRGWRITTMSIASRSDGNWIHALEAVLIGFLRPKYNKS